MAEKVMIYGELIPLHSVMQKMGTTLCGKRSIVNRNMYLLTKSLVSANAEYIHSEDMVSLDEIKAQQTKDIWLYGGSSIITSFINNNLIDEYRLSIHPVVLGSGKPLFEHLTNRVN